jgi:hypothetical protein
MELFLPSFLETKTQNIFSTDGWETEEIISIFSTCIFAVIIIAAISTYFAVLIAAYSSLPV